MLDVPRGRVDGQGLRVEGFLAGIVFTDSMVRQVGSVLVLGQLGDDAEGGGPPAARGKHFGHAARG